MPSAGPTMRADNVAGLKSLAQCIDGLNHRGKRNGFRSCRPTSSHGRIACTLAGVLANSTLRDPSPCDQCRFDARCQREQLACDALAVFALGCERLRWQNAPRVPTRARFLAISQTLKRKQRLSAR